MVRSRLRSTRGCSYLLIAFLVPLLFLFYLLYALLADAHYGILTIDDAAHVLNIPILLSESKGLFGDIRIDSLKTFHTSSMDDLRAEAQVRAHAGRVIAIVIDAQHRHIAIAGDQDIPLNDSQYNYAAQAFSNSYPPDNKVRDQRSGYTNGILAAVHVLKYELGRDFVRGQLWPPALSFYDQIKQLPELVSTFFQERDGHRIN